MLCWGDYDLGQLGVGTRCATIICTEPFEVCADAGCAASLEGVTAITAGAAHGCALAAGSLKCWGRNDDAELGHGVKPEPGCECRFTPVDVVGLPAAPKVTPTSSSTATRMRTATSTATRTAEATATPEPLPACGDVNGDGVVDSIDALLVLQYTAGYLLIPPFTMSADVDRDGAVTSIDASLILQYTAGRLASLRCPAHP